MSVTIQENGTKYLLIDHDIFRLNIALEFSLYTRRSAKMNMKLCKKKHEDIGLEDIITFNKASEGLYVKEEEYPLYNKFFNLTFAPKPLDENEIFLLISDHIYTKASDIMNQLFSDPETLGNLKKSKEVVEDLMQVILSDHFTLRSIMSIAEHDYDTHTHSLNVAIYSLCVGVALEFSQTLLSQLGHAALLHDLGKSKVDTSIINKNGQLSSEEFDSIKHHSTFGDTIAQNMGVSDKEVLLGIRHHHEKMDGSGYPDALCGQNIPLLARVVGMCDIFDALTSRRTYKEPMSSFEAFTVMKSEMSKHIDMTLFKQMIVMFR